MKAELILPPEFVDQIAERLFLKIKPLLSGNKSSEDDNILFNVKGLCRYLQVSSKWIYERTQFKEIPHLKVKGLLRFRKKEIDRWINAHNIPDTNLHRKILCNLTKNE